MTDERRASADPDMRLVARTYRDRGWAPLPLGRGGTTDAKVPTDPATGRYFPEGVWPSFVVDDGTRLIEGNNVGVILGIRSGGLGDVDLDCPEALALAPDMLPSTNSKFGRPTKPASHWLYTCDPPTVETKQFQTDRMFVELRATGGQTMFPPSVHDCGERLAWESDGEPTMIDGGALLRAVGDLAGMCLLVRHWPEKSVRYNAEGAFAGALLRAGRSEDEVVKLLKLIQREAGAARAHKPEKTAKRLSEKLAKGEPVPGLVRLRDILGTEVVNKAASWMGLRTHGAAYEEKGGSIYWLTTNKEGEPIEVRLCNFTAHISEVISRDDGSGLIERVFVVNGNRGAQLTVPAKEFDAMHWVTAEWGPYAAVDPGRDRVQRAATAIKELSETESRTVYAQLGWRKIDGQWLYIHAGGAIGAEGPVDGYEVDPGDGLAHYMLPPVQRLNKAILASLSMIDMGTAATALACAAYRAPTAEFFPITVSVFLHGPTGGYKSAIEGCGLAHWGSYWDGIVFPASWSSTANYLERRAFAAKNSMLVIDDFNPKGTQYEVSAEHSKADRLMRAQGNLSGRGRLNPDSTFRPTYAPRGLMVASGEDLPRGESLRARLVAIRVAPGDIDRDRLTELQAAAADGLLAEAMAGYVQWLAARADDLPRWLAEVRQNLRDQWRELGHARTPDNLANLITGLELFLSFAVDAGVISGDEKRKIWNLATSQLLTVVKQQKEEQQSENPVEVFCSGIREQLASGRGHLRELGGGRPADAVSYGWRHREWVADDGSPREVWEAHGAHIGWIEGDILYLLPTVALGEVNRLLSNNGRSIAKSAQALWKEVEEAGLLAKRGEETITIGKKIGGRNQRVLCLKAAEVLDAVTE